MSYPSPHSDVREEKVFSLVVSVHCAGEGVAAGGDETLLVVAPHVACTHILGNRTVRALCDQPRILYLKPTPRGSSLLQDSTSHHLVAECSNMPAGGRHISFKLCPVSFGMVLRGKTSHTCLTMGCESPKTQQTSRVLRP